MLQVLGAVAEHERATMLGQREEIAKAEGKYKGRAKTAMAKPERWRRCWPQADRSCEAIEDWPKQRLSRGAAAQHQATADNVPTSLVQLALRLQCS